MSILVTGGAGFIGSHTVVELMNAGYDVVIVDNLVNASEKSIERIEQIVGKKVKFYKVAHDNTYNWSHRIKIKEPLLNPLPKREGKAGFGL